MKNFSPGTNPRGWEHLLHELAERSACTDTRTQGRAGRIRRRWLSRRRLWRRRRRRRRAGRRDARPVQRDPEQQRRGDAVPVPRASAVSSSREFARMGQGGVYAQQDAEECWGQIVSSVGARRAEGPRLLRSAWTSLRSEETNEERSEHLTQLTLKCNITIDVNHLSEGFKIALAEDASVTPLPSCRPRCRVQGCIARLESAARPHRAPGADVLQAGSSQPRRRGAPRGTKPRF